MDAYAFVVETADGDTVEYRTKRCTATEAVERCRGKHPQGDILRTVQGDVSDVDFDFTTRGDSPTEYAGDANPTEDDPIETPPVDPTEMTVSEIEDALDDEDYDWNRPALLGLLRAERNGQGRSTAEYAIESELEPVEAE